MLLRAVAGLVLSLLLWSAAVKVFAVPAFLLPAPEAVLSRLAFLYENAGLTHHLAVTLGEIFGGFAIGAFVGVALGILFARFRRAERIATPLVLLLQTAPKIAIAPLLLLWLGLGPAPKIVLVGIVTFFPVMAGTITGLRYGETSYRDLASVLKLSSWQRLLHIEMPVALPSVLAGMRVATTLAMTAAVIGELMGASKGLGYLLSSGQESGDTPAVIGVVLLLSLVGWVFHEAVRLLERAFPYGETPMQTKATQHATA